MSTPLFLDKKLSFEKISMETKLSDNAEAWQQEITSEMFRQLPYLSDYSVNVMLDKVDQEKGYAFGRANVANIQENPEHGEDKRNVALPLVVKDRMLKPLDVLMHEGKSQPLSEDRVRQHLFRNQPFELSTRKPSDKPMFDKLSPPTRSHQNAMVSSGGFGKIANNRSLLESIAPFIPTKDAEQFIDKLASDIELKTALLKNKAFQKCAYTISQINNPGVEKTASAIVEAIKPTVTQFTKLAGGKFKVKWANANAFAPQQSVVSNEAAQSMLGPVASKMAPGDSITASTKSSNPTTLEKPPTPVLEAGQYGCQDEDGNLLIGNVFPVIDFENQPASLFLFTDGRVYALQEQISGTLKGPPQPIKGVEPNGYGVFISNSPENAHATLPITIISASTSPEGEIEYYAETDLGEPFILGIQQELQEIVASGPNTYLIPGSYSFVPLNEEVGLIAEPAHFAKVANLRNITTIVEIRKTAPDEFSLSGSPLSKLASSERNFLSRADTEFLLSAMGMGPRDISEKLAFVNKTNYIKMAGLNSITPLSELKATSTKIASNILNNFPWHLRKNLVKEAAAIPDQDTVDNVLSLGFLNQDNLNVFADYLPQLEETGNKLSGLLLASRMGLSPVSEEALVSAMRNTDEVVTGLKELQQKNSIA